MRAQALSADPFVSEYLYAIENTTLHLEYVHAHAHAHENICMHTVLYMHAEKLEMGINAKAPSEFSMRTGNI
jgi:hypothetical protein